MRTILFANGQLGLEAVRWLRGDLVGLVLNAPAKQRLADEIAKECGLPVDRIATWPVDAATLRSWKADIGLSVLCGHIFKRDILDALEIVNLHLSYLPWNRGAHPNVWAIVERTPAGVTLHYVDGGVDTGDIIAQCPVEVRPWDTGKTLYDRLCAAGLALLQETWPLGLAQRRPQASHVGTFHRVSDLAKLDRIDPDAPYTARALLDILRARTFAPYAGAQAGGIGVRVELSTVGEV